MKLFLFDFSQSYQRTLNTLINVFSNLIIVYHFYSYGNNNSLIDFSVCFIIYQYLFVVSEWGFNLFALDRIKNLNFIKNRHYFVNNIIISKCILGLFCCLIFLIFFILGFSDLSNSNLIYSTFFLIFCASLNPLWLYQSAEKIEELNKPLFVVKIFQILFILFFTTIENFSYFFISQGLVFLFLFFASLKFLYNEIGYLYEVKRRNIYAAFISIKKMFKYFLSNFYNNMNLSFWGIGLLYLGAGSEIILFNLVEIFYRFINVFTQSVFEPVFRKSKISFTYSVKILILILLSLTLIYFCIDSATRLFFPSFFDDLSRIFKVLFFVIIFFVVNKLISFFFLGGLKISLMNSFNSFFLFLHFLFFVIWFFCTNNTTIEIVEYLLFLNLVCFSILIIFIKYSNKNF